MAKDHSGIVERGLQLKKAGNAVIRSLGGREIHPINVRVGGFYKVQSRCDLTFSPRFSRLGAGRRG